MVDAEALSQPIDLVALGAINFDYVLDRAEADRLNLKATGLETEEEIERRHALTILSQRGVGTDDEEPGGSAYNTVRFISALDSRLRVAFIGSLGLEAGGRRFLNDFLASGLPTEFLHLVPDDRPGACFNLLRDQHRHLRTCPFANERIPEHLEILWAEHGDHVARARMLHVTSLFDGERRGEINSPSKAVVEFIRRVRSANPDMLISFDPGSRWILDYPDVVRQILRHSRLLFLNAYEFADLLSLPQTTNPTEALANRIMQGMQSGSTMIVLKLPGEVRCFQREGDKAKEHLLAGRLLTNDETRNPAGAGDALAAGILAGTLLGFDLERAAALGQRLAITKISSPSSAAAEAKFRSILSTMRSKRAELEAFCSHCGRSTRVSYTGDPPSAVTCAHCGVYVHVSQGIGSDVMVQVSGTNAGDVDRILSSTLERLPKETKMEATARPKVESEPVDVAILVALHKELDSVIRSKGHWERLQFGDDIRSYFRTITPAGVSVVAARTSGVGQLSAAVLTRDVVARFRPSKILLVGIAGGIGNDVQLGDIVVSDQIVDYELGKITEKGVSPRWSVHRSDALLRERLIDYKDNSWLQLIKAQRPDARETTLPAIHTGVVLSGNKVIADARAAGALEAIWTRAVAVEMEAAGIASVVHESVDAPAFVMVKAICDHADATKNDEWQRYAAEVAASFTISFVFDQLTESVARKRSSEKALPDTEIGIDMRALRFALSGAFDLGELRILVSDLGIDWDNVAGRTKDERIVELLWFMKRRDSMSRLINTVNEDRPGLLATFDANV